MHPHARIIPLGYAPGTRPRRERIEVSIIVPFHDEASVLPHCPERLQWIGEQLAVPCEFRSSMSEAAMAAPNTRRGKP